MDSPQPALTPGLGKDANDRKGSPSRQDLSPPSKGQHSEEEGQEVEAGTHPLVPPKLTPSLIQNLATGDSLCYQELTHPRNILKSRIQTHIHHGRHCKPAHPISDLTDLNRDEDLSLPRILLEFF